MKNDPANKPILKKRHFENTGYCLKVVNDIDPRIIEYPKWNNNNLFYNTMFYSNYDIKLSNNPVKLYIDTSGYNVSNHANSPSKLLKANMPPAIAFQRKRSGDTLQILSVLDDQRILSNPSAHDNSKMLITHDRNALYYSLLMGIDVGFTIIRNEGDKVKQYYLITFTNVSNKYTDKFDYKNNQRGGLQKSSIYKSRLNKTRRKNRNNKMDINMHKILPEISQYLSNTFTHTGYMNYIPRLEKLIENNRKHDMVKYVQFMYTTDYSKEYISKLLYNEYIDRTNTSSDDYNSILSIIGPAYDIRGYGEIIANIIQYYYTVDESFANYLRSLNCLLWLIQAYNDMIDSDNTYSSN
jgi:hypothetical protein